MFQSILATTDLSGHAREAVLRAARIARDTGAALHIAHVLQMTAVDRLRHRLVDVPADLRTRLDNSVRFAFEELAQAISSAYGVTPALRSVEGELVP